MSGLEPVGSGEGRVDWGQRDQHTSVDFPAGLEVSVFTFVWDPVQRTRRNVAGQFDGAVAELSATPTSALVSFKGT